MAKRAGRPRSPAKSRFDCGKIRPEARDRQPPATQTAMLQRIARGATVDNWTDQRHETPFGRLYRDGALGKGDKAKDLYDAGIWFAGLWRNMRSAIEANNPHARAPGGSTGPRGTPVEECDLLTAIARHRAVERVLSVFEKAAIWEVLLVERDEPPTRWVAYLVSGLPKLVAYRASGR